MKPIIIGLSLIAALLLSSKVQALEMALVLREPIKEVSAEVVVKDGKVVSSNCDSLVSEGAPGQKIKYTLQVRDTSFFCVPDKSFYETATYVNLDITGVSGAVMPLNSVADYKAALNNFVQRFIIENKREPQSDPPAPKCSLDSSGSINLSSCSCYNPYIFNVQTKVCALSETVVDLLTHEELDQEQELTTLLDQAGRNTEEPSGFQPIFPPSYKWLTYDFIQHPLLYKLLLFTYAKPWIVQAIESRGLSSPQVKLAVSKQELIQLLQWVKDNEELVENQVGRSYHSLETSLKAAFSPNKNKNVYIK